MAVPRLDPRANADRIYQYEDYAVLSAQFRKRKTNAWYKFIPILGKIGEGKPRQAIRLLPFKLGLATGLLVAVAAVAALAFIGADTARLEYEQQDYNTSLAGLEQTLTEALSDNTSRQSEIFAGNGTLPSEVAYPVHTKYLVLTNVPEADGKTLVEQLYPLSSKVITIDP
jgi:hypothetical protein